MKPIEMPSTNPGTEGELDNDLVQGRQFSFHDNPMEGKVAEGEAGKLGQECVQVQESLHRRAAFFRNSFRHNSLRAEAEAGRTAKTPRTSSGPLGPNTHVTPAWMMIVC